MAAMARLNLSITTPQIVWLQAEELCQRLNTAKAA